MIPRKPPADYQTLWTMLPWIIQQAEQIEYATGAAKADDSPVKEK